MKHNVIRLPVPTESQSFSKDIRGKLLYEFKNICNSLEQEAGYKSFAFSIEIFEEKHMKAAIKAIVRSLQEYLMGKSQTFNSIYICACTDVGFDVVETVLDEASASK